MVYDWLKNRDYDPSKAMLIALATTGFKIGRDSIVAVSVRCQGVTDLLVCDTPLTGEQRNITKLRDVDIDNAISWGAIQARLEGIAAGASFMVSYSYERFTGRWLHDAFPHTLGEKECLDIQLISTWLDVFGTLPEDLTGIATLHSRMAASQAAKSPPVDTLAYEKTGFVSDDTKPVVLNRLNQLDALWCQLLNRI